MAFVTHLEHAPLEFEARHSDVEATYAWVKDSEGRSCLQIDTYGSAQRKLVGKKSQSIRLSPEAIAELREILATVSRGKMI